MTGQFIGPMMVSRGDLGDFRSSPQPDGRGWAFSLEYLQCYRKKMTLSGRRFTLSSSTIRQHRWNSARRLKRHAPLRAVITAGTCKSPLAGFVIAAEYRNERTVDIPEVTDTNYETPPPRTIVLINAFWIIAKCYTRAVTGRSSRSVIKSVIFTPSELQPSNPPMFFEAAVNFVPSTRTSMIILERLSLL